MLDVFPICSMRYRDIVSREALAPHDDLHLRRVPGEVHRSLAGGVSAADDENAPAAERRSFGGRGTVVDARARVLRHAGSRMLAIEHARRGEHGSRHELASVGEREPLVPAVDRDARHLERREELGAEPLRLRDGAARQVAAADTVGEPEVVFDARARPRLSARAVAVEQERPQPFGGAVHRGRESGGARPDDHEVVDLEGRPTAAGRDARPPGAAPGWSARSRLRRTGPASASVGTPAASSSVRASASRSTSSQRYGMRLPARKSLIACDRVAHWCPTRRRPVASGSDSACHCVEKIVDHRKELFLRRSPWLGEVMIDMRLVDGPDRRLDVGVRRQQDAPGQRIHLARLGRAARRRASPACADR